MFARVSQQLSILPIDPRQVRNNLRESNDTEAGGINNRLYAGCLQTRPCATIHLDTGKNGRENIGNPGGIEITGSFSGGDQQSHNSPSSLTAEAGFRGAGGGDPFARIRIEQQMSSQREPLAASQASSANVKLSVGQFAERFKGEVIPLSNTFGYFCASVPMTEEVLKEYLEEPIAALPPNLAGTLPRISILLVPYLERSGDRSNGKRKRITASDRSAEFVVAERPAHGRQSWASQVSFQNETVLFFALKEQDVAEYHYRLYRKLAAIIAEGWSKEAGSAFKAIIREELIGMVHGEVDDDSWQAKQTLMRRQSNASRESPLFNEYVKQSFIDTLTLYLHGICCDIDVETGPRQLPSRYLRKRLNLLKRLYPPPASYAVFPEDREKLELPAGIN